MQVDARRDARAFRWWYGVGWKRRLVSLFSHPGFQYVDARALDNWMTKRDFDAPPTTTKMRARRVYIYLHYTFAYNYYTA